jgi:hypothetical protein
MAGGPLRTLSFGTFGKRSESKSFRKAIVMNELNRNRAAQQDSAQFDNDTKDRDQKREREARQQKKLDDALDLGLEDTFPASDPVAITQPPHSARDKRRY